MQLASGAERIGFLPVAADGARRPDDYAADVAQSRDQDVRQAKAEVLVAAAERFEGQDRDGALLCVRCARAPEPYADSDEHDHDTDGCNDQRGRLSRQDGRRNRRSRTGDEPIAMSGTVLMYRPSSARSPSTLRSAEIC
jgi:hypothetical protein